MRSLSVVLILSACLAAFTLAGCGSSTSSGSGAGPTATTQSTTHFAKTKFVLHAGLAFGAFHRYIYKPFQAGDFRHPFLHKLTLVKAGLAAVFIKHELGLTAQDVRSSKILRTLFSPITALAARFDSLKSSIEHGSISSADVGGLQSSVSSIESTAKGKGQTIRESVPSAASLS